MAEWADLHEGLLDLILSKLFDKDRHNFRLVCRSWNAAAITSPYPYSPCLIFYDRRKRQSGFFQYNSFFFRSFSELDDRADILCSNHGWLLVARDDDNKCFILGVASGLGYDGIEIGILRYGQNKWVSHCYPTEYDDELDYDYYSVSLSAPVLHRGLLYFLDMEGDVATFDVENHDGNPSRWNFYTNCLKFRRLRKKIRQHFLFKIKGEEALYAAFFIHDNELVNVFRLSEEKQWELVNDLGDKMLYLSHSSSFGDTACPRSMSSTICFPVFYGELDYKFVYYSMKTRKYHSFTGDDSYKDALTLSRLNKGAAWINPISTQAADFVWYSEHPDRLVRSPSSLMGCEHGETGQSVIGSYDSESEPKVHLSQVGDVNSSQN